MSWSTWAPVLRHLGDEGFHHVGNAVGPEEHADEATLVVRDGEFAKRARACPPTMTTMSDERS